MQFTGVIGALGLMLFGATVVAQTLPADDAGWYMGFGAGRSLSRLDGSSLTGKLDLPGFDPLATYTNSHATAYKAFGGYEFLRHFALEGSYFDLGRFSFAAPASPTGTLGGALRARGFGFDGVGLLPFTAKFGVFARLGGTYAQTRDSFSASGGDILVNRSPREWRANPKVGAGMQYLFTRHLAVRGEWERYRISETGHDHGHFDAWIVNLVFKMGGTSASTSVAAPVAPAEQSP